MSVQALYRPLFEVAIYHKYFLDDGTTAFDASPELKTKRLKKYNWGAFGSIQPTAETSRALKNHRLYVKQTASGVTVYAQVTAENPNATVFKPVIDLDENLQLEFFVYANDPLFGNYSQLDSVAHYPLVFRNYDSVLDPALPLINTNADNRLAKEYAITEATHDFLAEKHSLNLKRALIGLISLQMRGASADHHLLLANGNLPQDLPVFNLRFENRKTIWNYYSGKDLSLIYTSDPEEIPLVKNGIVNVTQGNTDYPAASPETVNWERDSVGTIIKTYSKIYIN